LSNSGMKVAYILTTFPCWTEAFATREMQELRRMGLDIRVLAATSEPGAHGSADAADVFYRPSRISAKGLVSIGYLVVKHPIGLIRLLALALRLLIQCPREAVSLIGNLHTIGFFTRYLDREFISHVHAYFLSWPAIIGLGLSTVANRRSLSISAHARDIFVEHGAVRLKVSRAEFVTVCTMQGLNRLKAWLPAEFQRRLHLNYHGTQENSSEPAPTAERSAESRRGDTIIAVGRLIRKKGFDNLIRAFALVLQSRPQCRLVIAGAGPVHGRLSALVEQLALSANVRLLGRRDHDSTLRLIREAAVLAVPSVIGDDGDRDGIPNVILEAFAAGTPVVASRLQGVSEAVEHRRTGLLVEPGDVAQLASAIEEMLSSEDLRSRMVTTAHETVVGRFDSVRNAEGLRKLFLSVNGCLTRE
jgi:glycosyltransferase involved in cell wall biosynthesis